MTITVLEAAGLIQDDYNGHIADLAHERINIKGVQAAIIDLDGERILLVRGTDELGDWFKYDFDFLTSTNVDSGDTVLWHTGFLHYAQIVYAFAKGKGITVVIGHSLGAAATQIVAPSLGVRGIAFASPLPLSGTILPLNDKLVENYCRPDDLVTMLPPKFLGFSHVGEVNWLPLNGLHIGEDHRISHYIELLQIMESVALAKSKTV